MVHGVYSSGLTKQFGVNSSPQVKQFDLSLTTAHDCISCNCPPRHVDHDASSVVSTEATARGEQRGGLGTMALLGD